MVLRGGYVGWQRSDFCLRRDRAGGAHHEQKANAGAGAGVVIGLGDSQPDQAVDLLGAGHPVGAAAHTPEQ